MSRKDPPVPIAEALRELRERQKLTQTVAGRIDGAPDHRTLSHWETGRKAPSLRLLIGYLKALGLDLRDLQDAIDLVDGSAVRRVDEIAGQVDRLARVCEDLGERRIVVLERRLELAVGRLAERLDAIESHSASSL